MVPMYVRRLLALLIDPRVPASTKALFWLVTLGYWLSPDLMPFLPFDDFIVALISSWVFMRSAEGHIKKGAGKSRPRDEADVIDVDAKVIYDEDENKIL